MATEVTIAGPGFINVRLEPAWLAGRIEQVATSPRLGVAGGRSSADGRRRLLRPERRQADARRPPPQHHHRRRHRRVLEFLGHHVIRQNHIGDWGTQFGMLIAHLAAGNERRRAWRAPDRGPRPVLQGGAGSGSTPTRRSPTTARATVVRLQAGGQEELRLWRKIVDESRRHFQPIYERLGVKLTPGDERGESFYNPILPAAVADLKASGVAVESEGATVVFTEGSRRPADHREDRRRLRLRDHRPRGHPVPRGGTLLGAADHLLRRRRRRRSTSARCSPPPARPAGPGSVRSSTPPSAPCSARTARCSRRASGDSVKLNDLIDEAEERALRGA